MPDDAKQLLKSPRRRIIAEESKRPDQAPGWRRVVPSAASVFRRVLPSAAGVQDWSAAGRMRPQPRKRSAGTQTAGVGPEVVDRLEFKDFVDFLG